ncbi:hypothetical protein M9Y10_038931 [Tritrichomonas musculus]|uniref:Initiator binding domain-containing protein n=1 Tax=Tritrichomonas musculus TaxID=1915356 RepID=A0ABR2K9R7_9EUKA
MIKFQTVEELRQYVNKDPIGSKLKFAAKLFIILDFTNQNPLSVNVTGTTWLSDGIRFITNSQIFGQFINLRPNSVNANFRSHFFKILHGSSSQIRKEVLTLNDPINYKIRTNMTYHFTISSTMEQINSIPCDMPALQQLKISYNNSETNLPDFVYNFLKKGEKEILLSTQLLYAKIKRKNEWKDRFFELAMREWKSFANDQIAVDIYAIQRYVTDDMKSRICSNISFLLNQQAYSSPADESISFDAYAQFVLQYGFLNQSINSNTSSLISITDDSIITDNDINEVGQLSPKFKKWFKPNFDENTATCYLSNRPNNTWIVRPSRSVGNFTLHLKRLRGNMATHIFFDPLNIAESFTVEVENGKELRASSWEDLLFNLMKVPTPAAKSSGTQIDHLPFIQQITNNVPPFTHNATIYIYHDDGLKGINGNINNNLSYDNNKNNDDVIDEDTIGKMQPIYVNAKEIIGPDTLLKDIQVFKPITFF